MSTVRYVGYRVRYWLNSEYYEYMAPSLELAPTLSTLSTLSFSLFFTLYVEYCRLLRSSWQEWGWDGVSCKKRSCVPSIHSLSNIPCEANPCFVGIHSSLHSSVRRIKYLVFAHMHLKLTKNAKMSPKNFFTKFNTDIKKGKKTQNVILN